MNQEHVGRKVAWHLDRGLDQLDQGTLSALAAARMAAVSRRQVYEASPAPVAVTRDGTIAGNGGPRAGMRWWVPASAIALAVAALIFVQTMSQPPVVNPNYELGALDAGLLADDLPISAYLDRGFDAWLDDTSE